MFIIEKDKSYKDLIIKLIELVFSRNLEKSYMLSLDIRLTSDLDTLEVICKKDNFYTSMSVNFSSLNLLELLSKKNEFWNKNLDTEINQDN